MAKPREEHYTRTFEIPLSTNSNVSVQIAEPTLRAEGLNLQTWTSGYLLARLLPSLSDTISTTTTSETTVPVLELGAGTGLVGLTASLVWDKPVILTDLAPIVPGLAHNIALNSGALAARSAGGDGTTSVTCGSLDWRDPTKLTIYKNGNFEQSPSVYEKASVILAADTVYSEEHPELLSNAVRTWLAPGKDSRAIIMYAMRVAYLDQIRELWQTLEASGLEAVQEGREQAEEENSTWDDELLCEWSVWKWRT